MLEDGPPGETDAELQDLLEAGGALDLVVEAKKELGRGPGHGGVEQLVPTAGEGAVDGGP